MADDKKGRGWFGDPEGHAKAGSQSSGNKNAAENLDDEDRSKGGSASGGNFKNDPQRAREAGKKGGRARAKNRS
jgi:general stress protein YciG